MLTRKSIVTAAPDQVFSRLAGDLVILDLKEGVYHGLNAVGARIWELIQEPISVEAVRNRLASEYDVDVERCEQEIMALFRAMYKNGLVQIS